ncbi:hypothetical protein [Aliarcobacter skirrowii]|uniref:Uncharacterized protein n=1 Tax=Aliarcobacter skirrowii CCUG 10374 TaxID=1032239 RepID=A0AAD0WNV6_9BACT|nr:hypothetical protein [Aliarcobacter skirrowii]AXX85317.1 hypothetical protein ASKIR_1526 [Aliarcobacter skirrowii CCUG 10374]KAB0620149.1 hypothetical protein F7P70_08910 [Aliarcobacter skirrowii CCUG 10374]RXI25217.1 hypothetical protein CP959_08945 [Aliarcobacter skirrowii CCUG 10374]SUU96149.1 Uncharacterised protein [Aliarcobacter skirrowii]
MNNLIAGLSSRQGSGIYVFLNLEWILPISTVIVILIYYLDNQRKKNNSKDKEQNKKTGDENE